ncbi:MAG: ROK family protein [Candidatus Woesearchaeota archaeon]
MILGIDVGGQSVRFGVFDQKKRVHISHYKTTTTLEQTLYTNIDNLCATYPIQAIGIAWPGMVKHNVILKTPNIKWKTPHIAELLEKKLHIPVCIAHDVSCFLYAFYQEYQDTTVLGLTLGTGLGGAFMRYGSFLGPMEIGHIMYNGQEAEALLGAKGIIHLAKTLDIHVQKPEQIITHKKGATFWHLYGTHLGTVTSIAQNLLCAHHVIIGGQIAKAHTHFKKGYNQALKKHTFTQVPKTRCTTHQYTGLYGATVMASKHLNTK